MDINLNRERRVKELKEGGKKGRGGYTHNTQRGKGKGQYREEGEESRVSEGA